MKPVRLGSGYSDDASPKGQNHLLQPRGLLVSGQLPVVLTESNEGAGQGEPGSGGVGGAGAPIPQFTVITSHYNNAKK